jgi:hypothetical protein
MSKTESQSKQSTKHGAEKPISLAPLSEVEAIRGLLQVKPVKGAAVRKASKKRTTKKAASR